MTLFHVVSGPPCSGKTFFIQSILFKDNGFHKNLNLNRNCQILNANQFRSSKTPLLKLQTVIHYDSMRSYKRNKTYIDGSDPFLKFMLEQQDVSTVLMVNPAHVLLERIEERYNRLKPNISENRQIKLKKLIHLYSNKSKFISTYLLWYHYLLENKKSTIYLYFNGFNKIKDCIIKHDSVKLEETLITENMVPE